MANVATSSPRPAGTARPIVGAGLVPALKGLVPALQGRPRYALGCLMLVRMGDWKIAHTYLS